MRGRNRLRRDLPVLFDLVLLRPTRSLARHGRCCSQREKALGFSRDDNSSRYRVPWSQTGAEPSRVISICLSAVVVAATTDEPRVLSLQAKTREGADALPSGQLAPEHRTLESGLRAWVERQTKQQLGYVEQLYTFGDRDRSSMDQGAAEWALAVAYLALVREARPAGLAEASWRNWYGYFPWEDWRSGRTAILDVIERRLRAWAKAEERTPSGGCAGNASRRHSDLANSVGTRSVCWSATSSCLKQSSCRRPARLRRGSAA